MKKLSAIVVTLALFFFNIQGVLAADPRKDCGGTQGIDTAIGCIPLFGTNPNSPLNPFMSFVIGWGAGVAGGIAFILILFSGFQIMTSSGNPQKLQAGKELLGAAVSGLLLLIFSAFILRVVGVDILQIF